MKQRLIDANNLYFDYIVASTTTNMLCYRYISKEQIENQPTVEAIPIEFIKKEMESSRYIWSNSGVKTELYWRGVYQGLMVLIRNWEKENDRQRNFR